MSRETAWSRGVADPCTRQTQAVADLAVDDQIGERVEQPPVQAGLRFSSLTSAIFWPTGMSKREADRFRTAGASQLRLDLTGLALPQPRAVERHAGSDLPHVFLLSLGALREVDGAAGKEMTAERQPLLGDPGGRQRAGEIVLGAQAVQLRRSTGSPTSTTGSCAGRPWGRLASRRRCRRWRRHRRPCRPRCSPRTRPGAPLRTGVPSPGRPAVR